MADPNQTFLDAQGNSAIPSWLMLMNQSGQVPPDQAQASQVPASLQQAQASQVPASLQADPGTPSPAAPSAAPLSQTPVPGQGLKSYLGGTNPSLMQQYMNKSQEGVLQQQGGLDQLQAYINQIAGTPTKIDFSPLAAYVDSNMPGSHLYQAAIANRGMTDDDKDKLLFQLQNQLQSGKQAVTKDQLDALGEMSRSQYQNATLQHLANMDKTNAIKAQSYGGRVQVRMDNQSKTAGDIFDKDPLLVELRRRSNQIGVDSYTLQQAAQAGAAIPPQIMDELTTGVATAIQGSKSVGLGSAEKQELESMQKDAAKVVGYGGTPVNALTPDQRQFLQDTLDRIDRSYAMVAARRGTALANGRHYQFNPQANATVAAKNAPLQAAAAAAVPQSAVGPTPVSEGHPDVTQDGHTYKWNSTTGKYE